MGFSFLTEVALLRGSSKDPKTVQITHYVTILHMENFKPYTSDRSYELKKQTHLSPY